MTPDQQRRSIRAELHSHRIADNDHTEERLWRDARTLDRRMAELALPHPHTWWGTKPKSEKGEIPPQLVSFLRGKSTITPSDDSFPHHAKFQGEFA